MACQKKILKLAIMLLLNVTSYPIADTNIWQVTGMQIIIKTNRLSGKTSHFRVDVSLETESIQSKN